MKRLILHVGTHKTGTSYLQLWLYRNRQALRSHGIAYPDFYMKMPNANHHGLADAIKLGQLDFHRAAEELSEITSSDKHVILSSETFSSLFHRGRGDAVAFSEAFGKFFSIGIVIYLRRQDEMLESAYAEIVKTGNAPSIEQMTDRPMNWLTRLQYLGSVFGADNVVARPYYPKAWAERHLARDFLASASLPALGEVEDIERKNEAMSRRQTLFLAMIDKTKVPSITRFVEQVRDSSAITDDGIKWLMTPEMRKSLVARYAKSNETMCDMFFDGQYREYFLADPSDCGSWFPPAPISVEEMISFQSELWTRVARAEAKCRSLQSRREATG